MLTSLPPLPPLPDAVVKTLTLVVDAAQRELGEQLQSIVLFGSAAEGRLRKSSDVNLIFVLHAFDATRAEKLRGVLSLSQSAVRLMPMFLLTSEIPAAEEMFAVKFADIHHRHRVLYGSDPFAQISIPRAARLVRLQQMLLNMVIRLRAQYVLLRAFPEKLAVTLAGVAGPLRACAASILELESTPFDSPKQALEILARSVAIPGVPEALTQMSAAREGSAIDPQTCIESLLAISQLMEALRHRVEKML